MSIFHKYVRMSSRILRKLTMAFSNAIGATRNAGRVGGLANEYNVNDWPCFVLACLQREYFRQGILHCGQYVLRL